MNEKNLQFFGVSEIKKTDDGLQLLRYPEKVVDG